MPGLLEGHFKSFGFAQRAKLSSKSELAKAITYSLKRWSALTRFLEDGRICMTNNAAERTRTASPSNWRTGPSPDRTAAPSNEPDIEVVDERARPGSADGELFRRQAADDLTLAGEESVDPRDRLRRDRRLGDPGEVEQFASGMGEASGLDDRPRLRPGS